MAGVLKSVLEEVVESFANSKFKKQSVRNALKNRGVKDIELKQSGMDDFINNYPEDKIPVEELKSVLAKRPDELEHVDKKSFEGTKESERLPQVSPEMLFVPYEDKSLVRELIAKTRFGDREANQELLKRMNKYIGFRARQQGFSEEQTLEIAEQKVNALLENADKNIGLYKARVNAKPGMEHGVDNHFNDPTYYSHTRFTDIPGEGRVVHEIQSDVHGAGAKYTGLDDDLVTNLRIDRAHGLFTSIYPAILDDDDLFEAMIENSHRIEDLASRGPDYINSNDGLNALSSITADVLEVNLDLDKLKKAQQYMIKYAEDLKELQGALFENKEPNWLNSTINKLLVDSANEGHSTVKVRIADDPGLHRAEGVQNWYENTVMPTLKKTAKSIGAETEYDGKYFTLKLPKDFKLPLYSAAGLTMLSAGTGSTEAEASMQDQELNQPMEEGIQTQGPQSMEPPQEGPPEVDLPTIPAPITQPEQQEIAEPTPQAPQNENWPKIYEGLKAGARRQQISSYMAKNLGMSEDEADLQIIQSLAEKVVQGRAAGASDQQITSFMMRNNIDPNVIDSALNYAGANKDFKNLNWTPPKTPEKARDLRDLYNNIHSKYSTFGKKVLGLAGNMDAAQQARSEIDALNSSIVDYLRKEGFEAFINPHTGEPMIKDNKGNPQEVDSSLINSMWNAKYEAVGAMGGALAGAAAGGRVAGAIPIPPSPLKALVTGVGAFGGATIAGAGGAMAGRGLDLVNNSLLLKEKLSSELVKTQLIEAGIADSVASLVGASAFKAGAAIGKGALKAYDFVLAGNLEGANRILLENMHISPDQAKEITENFAKSLETRPTVHRRFRGQVPMREKELQIAALVSTQQGAEIFASQSATSNPKLANALLKNIDTRAKDLLYTINKSTDDNVGALIREDLATYQKDVKDFYGLVKNEAADVIDGTDFRFDLEKVAIAPVMDNISKKLSDPYKREVFLNYASRIENASADRTFGGLVEMRQAVNDFKYSKAGLGKRDIEALNTVLNKIDTQLDKAVKEYMPNPKQWKANWTKAKSEYSKMKVLEENAMFKSLNRKAATEEQLQKVLNKYGNDLDVDRALFNPVLERLSPAVRAKAESAAIKNLTKKFTFGREAEQQVVNFPVLAEELNRLNLKTPEAKRLKEAVDGFAKVFKNDPALARVSGSMSVPKFTSSMSASIQSKAKYAIIGEIWQALITMAPGEKANSAALVKHVTRTLENPMHFKTTEAMVKSLPKEQQPAMRSLVAELRKQSVKQGSEDQTKHKMYRASASGKLLPSKGHLGKGIYLSDMIEPAARAKNIVRQDVDLTKLATMDNIATIIGKQVTDKEIRDDPRIRKALIDNGFLGVRLDSKAMLFDETFAPK